MSDIKIDFGIYAIKQKSTNKVYIGSTACNFYDRWCAHRSVLKRNKHSSIYLQRAWNKYLESDFLFEIIECLEDKEFILSKELYYINLFKSSNYEFGFNMTKEVSLNRLGHTQSKATRSKISKTLTGIKRSSKTINKISKSKIGILNPAYGKKQSIKTIAKRVDSLKKKIIREDGITFNSLKEAAVLNNCKYQSISQALRKGYRAAGFKWNYLTEKRD